MPKKPETQPRKIAVAAREPKKVVEHKE